MAHITGNVLIQGASRGVGLALVSTLLQRPEIDTVIATARRPEASEGLMALASRHGSRLHALPLDVSDPAQIERALQRARDRVDRLHLLMNVAGVLHTEDGMAPEKRLEALDAAQLQRSFAVNAIGPALVLRHALPLLTHGERAVVANLSARVGSIEDNRLGGWYGYRASKAAQNMLTRTAALELGRRAKAVICVALHPGTVATELSAPFSGGAPRRFTPEEAADKLLRVVASLTPAESGGFFDYDRAPIPW